MKFCKKESSYGSHAKQIKEILISLNNKQR